MPNAAVTLVQKTLDGISTSRGTEQALTRLARGTVGSLERHGCNQ